MISIEDQADHSIIKVIVVMHDGREVLCRTPNNIFDKYPERFVHDGEEYNAHQFKILNSQKDLVSDKFKQCLIDSCSKLSEHKDKVIYVDKADSDHINLIAGTMEIGKTYKNGEAI